MKRTLWLTIPILLGILMTTTLLGELEEAVQAARLPLDTECLQNPGFETATGGIPDYWERWGGTLAQASGPVHSGAHAGVLTTTTANGLKYVYQTITVTGGSTYQFSGWIRENDPNLSEAFLRLRWYASADGSGTALSSVDSTAMLTTDDPDYRFLTTGPITAPLTANSAKACFYVRVVNGIAGTAYFDDASFQRIGGSEPVADLAVAKTGAATAMAGDVITYLITLANTGSAVASNVRLTDTLPAGLDLIAQSSPFTATVAGNRLAWEVGDMAASAVHAITITAQLSDAAVTPLVNVVTATTTASETNTANNTTAWQTTVLLPGQPHLAVAKTGPATAMTGDAITYLITLANTGSATAPGVRLTDTLPAGLDLITQSSPFTATVAGNRLVWEAGDVTTDAVHAITLTARLSAAAVTPLVNVVTATTTASEAASTAVWSTTVLVASAPLDVVINEVAWMGTDAYANHEWIELHNTTKHALDLHGWTLRDHDGVLATLEGMVPAQGYYLLARDTTVFSGPVPQIDQTLGGNLRNDGEAITLTDRSGVVIDTANIERGYDGGWAGGDSDIPRRTMERITPTAPDADANWCTNDGLTRNGLDAANKPINGTPGTQNSCYRPPLEQIADLVVAKTGPPSVYINHPIVYQITLANTGQATATQVLVTDTLPLAVDFTAQSSSLSFTRRGRTLAWEADRVAVGASHTIIITGQVAGTAVLSFTAITNHVTATTTAFETNTEDNHAAWTSVVSSGPKVYLPLVLRNYTAPRYWVVIETVLYDGLRPNDYDEAVQLLNGGDRAVDLTGWRLCKMGLADWSCADLPAVNIQPHQRLWLARSGADFAASFGFEADYVLSGWPALANTGDEVALLAATGTVQDALVFRGGDVTIPGWEGPAVQPYHGANFALEGQVLYRILDEETGRPAGDTDTAADWAQSTTDPWVGRRVRYPGWDLEQFFHPAVGASGAVTIGVAPDNAYQLVVDTIRSARERIEMEVYTLEHYELVGELVQQARQGVSVTVLLEGGPVGGVEDQELWACQQLHATPRGQCYFMVTSDTLKIYDRYTYLHAKFIIVDRKRLLVGSQNLTYSGLPDDDKRNGSGGSRGAVLVTDAPEIVGRAVEIFQADCDPDHHTDVSAWGPDNPLGYGPPPVGFIPDPGTDWTTYTVQFSSTLTTSGDWFELVTAPESALRQSDALLGLVGRAGAGDGVYVEQLYEYPHWGSVTTAPNLRLEAYIAAARRGAAVRILLNGGNFGIQQFSLTNNVEAAAYVNAIAQAERLNLSAHLGDPTAYGIHNKMVLVDLGADGQYVHVGSINGSETSNKINREMALQVRSTPLFDYLYAVFEHDWQHQPPLTHLMISEVLYNPSGEDTGKEWIEIYNPTAENVNIAGWYLGDVGPAGEYGSGLYRFPGGAVLLAGGVIVVAQQANDVSFTPDYEFLIDPYRDNPAVPNMVRAGSWDGFGLALGNEGDEVLLLDDTTAVVDVVTYGSGSFPGVIPHPGVSGQGHSLERRPPERDTDDCSQDFFDRYPPTPGSLPK
ncbi:MAG TPA: DUF11 domain-containing protein [Chloroflexi bacterium]|nr:DUF11 domain-containing protein [Chloroflexota bacterium]